jgi:WD40 repeat protein
MRREKLVLNLESEFAEPVATRGRVGRPRFRLWTRGRLALLLVAAIGVPWLPIPGGSPGDLPMHLAHGTTGAVLQRLAVSPYGRIATTLDELGRVVLWPAVLGERPQRQVDIRGRGTVLALSRDGRLLAVGIKRSGVVVCDLGQNGREHPLDIPVPNVSDLTFAPDGRTLAIATVQAGGILLWDVEAGRPRMTLRGHRDRVWPLVFSPDGRSLVSVATSEQMVLIWALDAGRPRLRLNAPGTVWLAYSPDGCTLGMLASTGKTVQLWDARTGALLRTIADRSVPLHWAAFSTDGRLLATAASDGTASLWSLATGRELKRLNGRADLLSRVAFAPDGRTLAAIGNDADIRFWDLDGLRGIESSE